MDPVYYNPSGNPAALGTANDQDQQLTQFSLHNPNSFGAEATSGEVHTHSSNAEQVEEPKQDADDSNEEKAARQKRKRASKACDACRVRKVKCDATRMPCPQCAEHNIPCLFTVPTKKRGPPNAYVEAQKAKMAQGQQAGGTIEPHVQMYPYPDYQQNPTRMYGPEQPGPDALYQAHSPGFGHVQTIVRHDMGLEALATPEVLNMMFDDFFTFVYPICPIILESQFRRRLSNPATYTNDFLALCASILASTIACLKSNTPKYGHVSIESCQVFTLSNLGWGYRDRVDVSIAATLEYLALSDAYSSKLPISENIRGAMFRSEFTCAVQFLTMTHLSKKLLNFVDEQLLKRMFTYIDYVQISLSLQGIHPSVTSASRAAITGVQGEAIRPLDISDQELERVSQAGGDNGNAVDQFSYLLMPSANSYVPGLELLSGLYRLYADSQETRSDENLAPDVRFASTCDTLQKVRHYLDNVPLQLRWEENNKVHGVGFEVQKANIYVSRMHLSSVLLEQCHTLESRCTGTIGNLDLESERRLVISETLRIIKTISRRALEANGHSMVKRVRQVASTLVDIIQLQKDSDTLNARHELSEFAEILSVLDPSTSDSRGNLHNVKAGPNVSATQEDGWRRFRNEQGLDASQQ